MILRGKMTKIKENEGKRRKMKKTKEKVKIKNLGRAGRHLRPDQPGKILGPGKNKNYLVSPDRKPVWQLVLNGPG